MPLDEVKNELNKQKLMQPEIPEVIRKAQETQIQPKEVITEDGTRIITRSDGSTITISGPEIIA